MAIHLVGETIDAKRAQADELLQIVRGIYVDQDVDEPVAPSSGCAGGTSQPFLLQTIRPLRVQKKPPQIQHPWRPAHGH